MDDTIKRAILGMILCGVGKATYIQLKSGRSYHRPEVIPMDSDDFPDRFGIKDPDEPTEVHPTSFDDVEIAY